VSTALVGDLGLLITVVGAGLGVICLGSRRSAQDVVADLGDEGGSPPRRGGSRSAAARVGSGANRVVLGDELAGAGVLTVGERRRFGQLRMWLPIGCVLTMLLVRVITAPGAGAAHLPFLGLALGVGYLAQRRLLAIRRARYVRALEFHLPLVMENVVMAVEAGLDIIGALRASLELDARGDRVPVAPDPVSRLFGIVVDLTESGLRFEESLTEVANGVSCAALRHAFIHLGVAWREGGEIIGPLRELANSTQLYYQETAEEEIARLPVQATMPLLMTFAGLLLCFMTAPLIQVIAMLERGMG